MLLLVTVVEVVVVLLLVVLLVVCVVDVVFCVVAGGVVELLWLSSRYAPAAMRTNTITIPISADVFIIPIIYWLKSFKNAPVSFVFMMHLPPGLYTCKSMEMRRRCGEGISRIFFGNTG